jgi:hypothetical protein
VDNGSNDSLKRWLATADQSAGELPAAGALASAALARARTRNVRRKLTASAVGLLLVASIGLVAARPWFARNSEIARLRAEVKNLRAKSDQMATEIAALRQARNDTERDQLVRSAFSEERNRAAYVLVRSADRVETVARASDVADATYRRVEQAFPETAWAAEARRKLKDQR